MFPYSLPTFTRRRSALVSAVAAVLSWLTLTAGAQTVDSVFVSVPDSVLNLLDRNARLDLLDYANAGMEAKVRNRLEGTTELIEKTDTTLTLQLTPASQWSLRVVTGAEGVAAYVVRRTLFLPEAYCREVRYDAAWHLLPD